ncbi:MAG: DUF1214 domain-containing protein [Steroidobacteraceae bacterium]
MSDSYIRPATAAPAAPVADFGPIVKVLAEVDAAAEKYGLGDPRLRAAYHAQVLMILSGAYVEAFGTDIDYPDWVPYLPYYVARAAPNPDTVYQFAPIDANGTYRISGVKGTETIAAITLRKGGAHIGLRSGARVGEIDFANLQADAQGRYSFVLSRERPQGYDGQWFELHPETNNLMLRRVTKNASQVDGTTGIERLDRRPAPAALSDAQVAARFDAVARYVVSQNEFLLGYMKRLRGLGAEQSFVLDDQSGYGGLIVQSHYFHQYTLAPDEALILESPLPKHVKYWSIQVITPFAATVEYALHQSSLNDAQAQRDADGRVRCVLAHEDPGVPNWLDPAGWHQGGVQWRWNEVDEAPHPTVRKVKLAELRAALPPGTPRVSAEQRRAALSARAAYYQARRR